VSQLYFADCSFARSNESNVGVAAPAVIVPPNNHLWLLPSLPAQQRLLDIYFTDWHHYMPFLDQGMCGELSVYLSLPATDSLDHIPALPHTSSRNRYRERATLILYAIFLVAMSHMSEPLKCIPGTPDDYYHAILDLLDQLDDHLTLETVQVLLMLSWREQGCDQSQRAWLHLGINLKAFFNIGSAIRVAQDIGLDHSCVNWPILDDREKKTRTTTWWICYIFDIATSIRMGRKPVIRENDFDVPLPEDPGEQGGIGLQAFIHAISLCRIVSRILDRFYSLRRSSQTVFHLNRCYLDLRHWESNLPPRLKIIQFDNIIHSSVYTIHILFHTAVLLLHRPFLSNTATRNLSVPIYRSSAFSFSFTLSRYRSDHNYSHSSPFDVHFIFTNAIAHMQSARSNENSIALAANSGLQECLTAFNAIRGTWKVAGRALNLLVDTFNLGNVIFPQLSTPNSQEEVNPQSTNSEVITELNPEWQSPTNPTQFTWEWDRMSEQRTSPTSHFEALFGLSAEEFLPEMLEPPSRVLIDY